MKIEKRNVGGPDSLLIEGYWYENDDAPIDQNELQDRLNKAHAIGFKDGVKAADLISGKEIENFKRWLNNSENKIEELTTFLDTFIVHSNGLSRVVRGLHVSENDLKQDIQDLYTFQHYVEEYLRVESNE